MPVWFGTSITHWPKTLLAVTMMPPLVHFTMSTVPVLVWNTYSQPVVLTVAPTKPKAVQLLYAGCTFCVVLVRASVLPVNVAVVQVIDEPVVVNLCDVVWVP